MSNKALSLFLAVLLTVSMAVIAIVSVSAENGSGGIYIPSDETETYRYYFYMPSDWKNSQTDHVGIYWWNGTDAKAQWPGNKAVSTSSKGVYYCDVPQDVPEIMWNNYLDGGNDTSSKTYANACNTSVINSSYYEPGDSEKYPDGLSNFDNMIFVINPTSQKSNEPNGQKNCVGEWYYYYGNGEYGTQPTKDEAQASEKLFNTDYQPPKMDSETTTKLNSELTINATSNYFPQYTQKFNKSTEEISVTYFVKLSKNVENFKWTLSYDSNILALSNAVSQTNVMPAIENKNSLINLNAGKDSNDNSLITGNGSDILLYNFTDLDKYPDGYVPFVKLNFNVINTGNTTVDLNMEYLTLKAQASDTSQTAVVSEGTVIDKLNKSNVTKTEVSDYAANKASQTATSATKDLNSTTTTDNNTIVQNESIINTVPTKAVAVNATIPTVASVSAVETDKNANADNNNTDDAVYIKSGNSFQALLVFVLILAASCAIFVIRKKEEI